MKILITGGSRGIGRACVELFAKEGHEVVFFYRSSDSTANEICEKYNNVSAVKCDVSDPDEVRRATQKCAQILGDIDVLINNAGAFSFCDIVNTPSERIVEIITLHDITNTLLCKIFATDMASRGGGHILNMSSYSIWMPWPGLSLYSASKAYLKSFSVSFAKEVCDKKVYVTAVCPAGIATDLYGLSKKWQKIGLNIHALSTPQFCARRALNSMFRHCRCIVPDWWMRLLIPLLEHLPMFCLRWIRNFTQKWQK